MVFSTLPLPRYVCLVFLLSGLAEVFAFAPSARRDVQSIRKASDRRYPTLVGAATKLFLSSKGLSSTGSTSAFSPKTPLQKPGLDAQQQDQPAPPRGTAIVLNLNARAVNSNLGKLAEEVFGEENVFVTSTQEEAREAAGYIVQKNYSTAVPVGGDGTLSSMIQFLCQEIVLQNHHNCSNTSYEIAMKELPLMGYIPMGTGNGVGSVVGCKIRGRFRKKRQLRHVMESLQEIGEELRAARQQSAQPEEYSHNVINMPMMEVIHECTANNETSDTQQNDLCFFAGVGFDSLMLDDFKSIKAWSKRTGFLTHVLSSVTGYCVALVVKTLPKAVRGAHNIRVTLTTRSAKEDTLFVDHRRGDFVRPVRNTTLYSGKTGILAAGTSPFYGGGLRIFPFARMTVDKMHLRLGRIHPLVGFLNIPSIFQGSYRDKSDRFGVLDFIGDDFEVEVGDTEMEDDKSDRGGKKRGFPFQHSGESVGHVQRFRMRVVKEPVRFVSLDPE